MSQIDLKEKYTNNREAEKPPHRSVTQNVTEKRQKRSMTRQNDDKERLRDTKL